MAYIKGVAPVNGDLSLYLQNELSRIQTALGSGASTSSSGGTGGSSNSEGGSPGIRLSLTANTAITSADVASATTIYGVPVGSSGIGFYDGTNWSVATFKTDRPLVLDTTGHLASREYSIFAYFDGTDVRLGTGPVWPTATSAGVGSGTSEAEVFEGRLVNKYDITLRNNSATTNIGARKARLVGGFGTTTSSGVTEDSVLKRLLSNVHNAAPRVMKRVEPTDSWAGVATDSWRQANGNALNQLEFFQITANYPVTACVNALVQSDTSIPRTAGTGIGLDSTSAAYLTSFKDVLAVDSSRGWPQKAYFHDYVSTGRHTLVWLEVSGTTDNRLWYGDAGNDTRFQTGINGTVYN